MSSAATNSKLMPQQDHELDSFLQRLPPDLIPYKRHIRAMTVRRFKESPDEYVKNFLASTIAIESLQMLRDQFDALLTDKEFDAE